MEPNSTSPPAYQGCNKDSTAIKVFKTMAYVLLLLATLIGNSLVTIVIWRNKRLRTIITFFILNMAVSDLLLPFCAFPGHIQHVFLPWGVWLVGGGFATFTCKLLPFAENMSITVSVLTLELIAIDRFFNVVFHTKKQPINTKKKCFILIALTWLVAILFSSFFFYKRRIAYKDTTRYCISTWEPAFNNVEAIKVQFPITLTFLSIIPLVLLIGLYSAIIIVLQRQNNKLSLAPSAQQRREKRFRRVTFMLIAVVVVFICSWIPVSVYWFLLAYWWKTITCQTARFIFAANFLSYTYAAINPIIYYIFMEDYRNGFRELLGCQICFKKQNTSNGKQETQTLSL